MRPPKQTYGFAKIKGFSFWPAKITGEFKGKLWVKFFGTKQLGLVSKAKNWSCMEESSLKQFATEKNLRKKGLLKATIEFVDEIKNL